MDYDLAKKLKDGGFVSNQGIYGIYQSLQRSEMEKLFIISNNAFGNIGGDDYKRLKNELNGTLYYWEICDKNI